MKRLRAILSVFLVLIIVFGMLKTGVFAEESAAWGRKRAGGRLQ